MRSCLFIFRVRERFPASEVEPVQKLAAGLRGFKTAVFDVLFSIHCPQQIKPQPDGTDKKKAAATQKNHVVKGAQRAFYPL